MPIFNRTKSFFQNYSFAMTGWRLGLVFVLYSFQRLIFYWVNNDLFPGISPAHLLTLMQSGLKFDLTALLYTNLLFILLMLLPLPFKHLPWYKISTRCIFLITNGIAFAINIIDFVYFRYTLRRSDFGVFTEFKNENNLTKVFIAGVIQYWYLLVLFIVLIGVLYYAYGDLKKSKYIRRPLIFYPVSTIVLALSLFLTVIGIRGGAAHSTRPITISNANEKVSKPIETAIVLNTPFSLIRTISRTRLPRVSYFSDEELASIYTPIHTGAPKGRFKSENVVVIILESFIKEASGVLNPDLENGNYKGYTPFLDSLIRHSYTWENAYANGQKSIDAIPSIIAGIPSLVQPFILSRYSLNDINGLPHCLKEKGYSTAFFHGAPNGSMGFNAMTNLLSIDHYFGMDEYGNKKDFDGYWGIPDDLFLGYCAGELGKLPQPFFASVFTLSSHHPYIVPQKYEAMFEGGINPVYKAIQYSDMSLRLFFEKISKTDWYNNTLFVLTADHSLASMDHEKYKSTLGSFSIPIIFFKPGDSICGFDSSLVQQIDIFPTVLGYLNYDEPYFAFGNDRFNDREKPFVINYINGIYQYMEDGYLLQFNDEKATALFNFKKDINLKNNLLESLPDTAEKLISHSRAFIQQYNNRMIDNELYATKQIQPASRP